MNRYLGKFSDEIYALMRIVVGFFFFCHGAQKMFGAFGGSKGAMTPLVGVGGFIELVGGALIALGLLASWAAFVSSGQMAVAYFLFHFPNGFLPIQNGGELAAVYAFVYLYIAARGSGRWSVASAVGNPNLS